MGRSHIAWSFVFCTFALVWCLASKGEQPAATLTARSSGKSPEAKVRKFTFEYRFRVKGLNDPNGAVRKLVRVWMPSPPSDDFQKAEILLIARPGAIPVQFNRDSRFGNRIAFFELPAPDTGEFEAMVAYDVTRHEVRRGLPDAAGRMWDDKLSNEMRALYLGPDKMVPVSGKSLRLLDAIALKKDKFSRARQLYDVVDKHVTYKKEGTGWGRGDTNWVCESGYGN